MREVDLTVRISEGANREIIHRSDFFHPLQENDWVGTPFVVAAVVEGEDE